MSFPGRVSKVFLAASLFGGFAVAASVPIGVPTSFLTPSAGSAGDTVSFSSSWSTAFPYTICPHGAAGCGGGFEANIKNAAGTSTISNASLWCVDYQNDVHAGETYRASIVSLASTASSFDNSSYVRYGGVTDTSSGPWVNNSTNNNYGLGASAYNTALSRYALAATLIMAYQSSVSPNDIAHPENNLQNQEIQTAIWELTENTLYGSPAATIPVGGSGEVTQAEVQTWITYAINHVSSTNLSDWAVVSGAYQSNGQHPATWDLGNSDRVQTFLVEVTPEPSFYGLLAIGAIALLYGLRRQHAIRLAQDSKLQ